jgi:UTP--glucose-1-phosphate uridylyltransferase
MMEVFEETQCSIIATQEVDGPAISAYGVLDAEVMQGNFGGRVCNVRNLVEKPRQEEAPSNLAIIGRYILTPKIFETLERTPLGAGGELQLTDGLRGLLSAGEKICGYCFEGKRHDTGDKLGFLKATVEFALKRSDMGEQFADYLRSLDLFALDAVGK